MLRSGEILVFRHDHLSFAYEGLTFGTLCWTFDFCRQFTHLFGKCVFNFMIWHYAFLFGMLFKISCDFGEPRALDLQKIRFESVIILQYSSDDYKYSMGEVSSTNIPWGKLVLKVSSL